MKNITRKETTSVDRQSIKRIFIDEFEVSEKNIAKKDDIIYSRTGQVGLVFKNKTGVVYNNCFKVIS